MDSKRATIEDLKFGVLLKAHHPHLPHDGGDFFYRITGVVCNNKYGRYMPAMVYFGDYLSKCDHHFYLSDYGLDGFPYNSNWLEVVEAAK